MIREFEYKGYWWLPNAEDDQIAGTLNLKSDKGIILELFGTFDKLFGSNKRKVIGGENELENKPIIYGITSMGKKITLIGCNRLGWSFSIPGYEHENYRIEQVYFGSIELPENFKFSTIELNYTYLLDWLGEPGISYKYHRDKNNGHNGYKIEYIEKNLNNNKNDFACITSTLNIKGSVYRKLTLFEQVKLKLINNKPLDLMEWWNKYIFPIQNFLSFATDRINSTTEILTNIENDENHYQDIHIYFGPLKNDEEQLDRELLPHEILFGKYDVDFQLNDILNSWLKIYDDIKGILSLFISNCYSSKIYLENRFLNIATCIEGYHRRIKNNKGKFLFNNTFMPKNDYKKFKDDVLKKCDIKYCDLLSSKLQYNEVSLKKRLSDVILRAHIILGDFINDKDIFIDKTVKYRNALIHRPHKINEEEHNSSEMFWITEGLMYVFRANLIQDLGIPIEKSISLFKRNEEYKFRVHRIKSLLTNKD